MKKRKGAFNDFRGRNRIDILKYQWLITCNHEQIVYFVGKGFDFSCGFPEKPDTQLS